MGRRSRDAGYHPNITKPQKLIRRTNLKNIDIHLPLKTRRGILCSTDNIRRTPGSTNIPSEPICAAIGNIEIKPIIVKQSSRSTSNDDLLLRDSNNQKVDLKNEGFKFSICTSLYNLGNANLMKLTSNKHGMEYGLGKPLVESNEEHVNAWAERKNIDNVSNTFGPNRNMIPRDVNELVKQKGLLLKRFDYWYNWYSKTKENIPCLRSDQMAINKLKEEGYVFEKRKIIGPIPGVKIGDSFNLRVQLVIMGLHTQDTKGIDYMSTTEGKVSIATSIVTMEGYNDVFVNSDELIYTGEGSTFERNVKFPKDRRLEGGNFALSKSMMKGTFVRVIRGFKIKGEKNMKNYVYDGLYNVVHCYQERAQHGRMQWKFKLLRCSGQNYIDWKSIR
ncbi:uncharacterized protein LOC110701843 [Chenopodium quinoa]|uniref:YDG domain-containing protein n=1 Tax=Chenopodium quinoa TaxID=63459 RepID=A0A803LRG0_CHEQI|nr:uncharacterized protein LOC110701843 [Chenopodium quinoa]